MSDDVRTYQNAPPRTPLPTPAQIRAITDVPSLEAMEQDIQGRISKIETDLEYGDGDDEWARRARGALGHARAAMAALRKQLHYYRALTPLHTNRPR